MRTLGMLGVLLLLAGGARGDDALLKEEMAALRKELVQVRMEQRRVEAGAVALEAKRAGASEMLDQLPEVRAALKDDARLRELLANLADARKHVEEVRRILAPGKGERQLEQAKLRVEALSQEYAKREIEITRKAASVRESLDLAERKAYLAALRKTLEADLAKLAEEAKKRGG
ncbi:MAG: hypothetical protein K2W96_18680 [Gemmataceae bacterium]|nr:hypothetical protein [Gemmataceae bacterium]